MQTRREIAGVCLIALGLFFGVSLYSDAVGILGAGISGFSFGMLGLVAYAFPVICLASGIAIIIASKRRKGGTALALALIGVLCILVMIQINHRPIIQNVTVIAYWRDAYLRGADLRLGGGLIGSLLAYPSLLLIGETGSYIFYGAGILILILIVTKLSLRNAGEKVGEHISNGINAISESRNRRQALYLEEFGEEVQQDPLPRRSKRQRPPIVEEPPSNKLKHSADELEFLPVSGPLNRREAPVNEEDPFGFDEMLAQSGHLAGGTNPAGAQKPAAAAPAQGDGRARADAGEEHPLKAAAAPQSPVFAPVPAGAYLYQRPPYTLMNLPKKDFARSEQATDKAKLLLDTLASFNISAKLLDVSVGPAITRYELQPAQGVRVSRITSLADDIALALAAPRVRIEAPIPGKAAIGIEVPNPSIATVLLREVIESPAFINAKSSISFALGKDIAGNIAIADLDKMPHLLIAGATGSGKSVCLNNIIISMIYKSTPEELKLILVDPKVVELKMFSNLPHLLVPVVTDPKKAAGALRWAVLEMEQRYQKLAKHNVRSIAGYNSSKDQPEDKMPKIVIIIDELADLMMVAAKDVEESICRIAQLGRACGIHLIVATQRPSVDIITGLIKANIPSRIAFAVSSAIDSRVILDFSGAEKLLGRGDMLFHANGASKPVRIQGAFVSDEEVEHIADFFDTQPSEPQYDEEVLQEISVSTAPGAAQGGGKQEDELLPEAVKIVLDSGQASISMIQRRLRVGYARAARLIDIMEKKNIVSGFDGSKPRKLLIDYVQYAQMFPSEQTQEDS
ncbi:MAG: DNA translocase FtsK [Bacillota bacterium]